jgi:UTP--glucose-1-phosphate uridylyltransferase
LFWLHNPAEGLRLESLWHHSGAMAEVLDAVLVAGGLGTRMLPASASIAKEALPLVDIPVLTHLAREAVAAGAKRLHIITSPRKDLSPLLADNSWLLEKRSDLDPTILSPFADVEVLVHIQQQALGLANAISTASSSISGPFLVLLGDNLLMNNHTTASDYIASNASAELVRCYTENNLPCVGLVSVEDDEVCNYGVVEMDGQLITSIVEKPDKADAPSNLVLCGRYIFTEDFSDLLNQYELATYGELQSIVIQQHWMDNEGLVGVKLDGYQWYDSGAPLPWLKSQIDHALRRPDMNQELKDWLIQRLG